MIILDTKRAFCGYGDGMDFTARFRASAKVSILLVCGLMLLSACGNSDTKESTGGTSNTEPTYAVFDRAAEESDELPSGLPEHATDAADETTARNVGAYGATSLWLMRGEEPATICLVAHVTDEVWISGCGGDNGPFTLSGDPGRFTVLPDGAPSPNDATQVSENIYSY